ncbi:unnamed protein product [Bursaphelenchus okinawaensis]|uniref:Sulfhydryl oxidase n=1 Tax=Bursaphelenchus okinawaensis TaxID=465554 RepID=A0A811LMR8_9BILA|nr:unnamed protein product [Bursaphelenchus okinawaensis]CAG9127239.1 unnamed protein product [Bursaphelenchus okinawaensis]
MWEIRPCLSLLLFISLTLAEFADFGTKPKGENPTLYNPENDPIVQLDETTFNDTIYCVNGTDCTSYMVEFYSDWCGHCRAYAPLYKSLANDVAKWKNVVRIGAINCADPLNENTCRANGVMFFPLIKYFSRNSSADIDGQKLKTYQSVALMRDQLTQAVVTENDQHNYPDWPNFQPLKPIATYSEIFDGVPEKIDKKVLVFEEDPQSLVGTQLILDLQEYSDKIAVQKCRKGHPLTEALHISDYPTVAIFKRGEHEPIMQAELRRLLFNEIEEYLGKEGHIAGLRFGSHPHNRTAQVASDSAEKPEEEEQTNSTVNECERNPDSCKAKYYASELDMLKAMRYALLREVTRNGGDISGNKLSALYTFTDALANHFPHKTISQAENGSDVYLDASSRARVVFTHMRDFIKQNGLENPLPADEWKAEFVRAEEDQGKPFPTNSDWQHCKGSSPQYRGYTCGLWTTFHALTVHNYKNKGSEEGYDPKDILKAIRGWVGSFFGCEHCRQHFLKMTGKNFKMDDHIHKPEDAFLYLWRAHNIVNARLKGRDTEDPKYPKVQFPASFLCPECKVGGDQEKDEETTKQYLLNYYSNIRPVVD